MIETLDAQSPAPSRCERLELEAVFLELLFNTPAELTFTTLKTLRDGQQFPCAQTAQVRNAGLLQRVSSLKSGDKIKVCIETDWASQDIPVILKACALTV